MREILIALYASMMESRYGYPHSLPDDMSNDDVWDSWEKYGGVLADLLLQNGVLPEQTIFATPVLGEIGYLSADNTWTRAIATSATAALVRGIYAGSSDAMVTGGPTEVRLVAGLVGLAAGNIIVCSTSAGLGTVMGGASAPGVGQYLCEMGTVYDASIYAGTQRARIIFNPAQAATRL